MKILKQLIHAHRPLFTTAVLFTLLSILLQLCWNQFLAEILNRFGAFPPDGILLLFSYTASEYLSAYLASYTCEAFAHDMRMGYARYYLQSDLLTLTRLNVGEEQSAMQNELREVSDYFSANLFPLIKQFGAFVLTAAFLLYQNTKLAMLSILPVVPLIFYCSFSSKIIKNYTEQCQSSKKKINGLANVILDLFPVIHVYGAYRLVKDTMQGSLAEWKNANIQKERISARLLSLSGVFSFLPLLLLLGLGGFMVIRGEIRVGTFYIFINLSGNVSGFLQNMPGIYANFRRFGASVGRLEKKLVLREV